MTKVIKNEWNPDIVSPPGETLAEELEVRGLTPTELASQIDYPLATVIGIINGEDMITPEIAARLEQVFGVSAAFWNNRERRYRESLARQSGVPVAA